MASRTLLQLSCATAASSSQRVFEWQDTLDLVLDWMVIYGKNNASDNDLKLFMLQNVALAGVDRGVIVLLPFFAYFFSV